MQLPNVIVFVTDAARNWKGGIGVALIAESDLEDTKKDSNVVATVKLTPEDHRGDMLLAALAAETLGTPDQRESFYGALENLLQETFLAGVRQGVRVSREKLEE